MNNTFKVNTKLALFDYLAMVNGIVSVFFNDNGDYQPQIGKLNAMRLFYNHCVIESKFDEKYNHNITDANDMVEIVTDKNFIRAYNDAINIDTYVQYDFGNAYKDAMEIVNVRKTSFGNSIEVIKNMIMEITDKIDPMISEENIANVSKIAKDISDGKISADSVVEAYAKRIANHEKDSAAKVIPINELK